MEFTLTAVSVLVMLSYAVPGFLLIKTKMIKPDSINAFAKVLLFVCQPCLSVYSFQKVTYTPELFKNMLIFLAMSVVLQAGGLLIGYLLLHKKYDDITYRVTTVASVFGNVGFFGVPLLETLLPQYPEAVAYSAVFIVSMNVLSWTLGSAFLTNNKKYVSLKNAFINPPVLSLIISLPLFFTCTKLPSQLFDCVALLGKMTTPLCMLILGMRFAASKTKEIFTDGHAYFNTAIKLVLFPMAAFLCSHWLPINYAMKATVFILACCPTASVTLNLCELYGAGQETAARSVLVCTVFCIITIPLLLMIL